jgi:hypothetical protein
VHELDPLARQVGKSREVRRCREPLSFEAAHLARRCCVTVSRCPADNPAHRRIVAQALGVVHVLISSKAAEHRLPQQADQRMTRGCASRTPLKLPSLRSWGARSRCLARRWRTTDAGRIGPPALTLSYYVETRGSSRPVSKSGPRACGGADGNCVQRHYRWRYGSRGIGSVPRSEAELHGVCAKQELFINLQWPIVYKLLA